MTTVPWYVFHSDRQAGKWSLESVLHGCKLLVNKDSIVTGDDTFRNITVQLKVVSSLFGNKY